MNDSFSLSQMGWHAFYQQQLSLEEWENFTAGRVVAQHRSVIELLTEKGKHAVPVMPDMPALTVGDWLLLDEHGKFFRALDRLSLFSRKAPGNQTKVQLIAANIDTLFIVCSLNHDFNLSRIERYLALAKEAGVDPVLVLTKLDCCNDPQSYIRQVRSLDPLLMTAMVNGLDPCTIQELAPWCRKGKTVALLGSSGVGKSSLVNTLLNMSRQATGGVRSQDSKGRHTTTHRSLVVIPSGGLLLDTPGMRELQLFSCESGIKEAFNEITELATRCQFSDCQHESEPGCSVKAAIEAGELDERRFMNYLKLLREQAMNSTSLAERRAKDRSQSKYYRSVQAGARQRKQR